MILSVFKEFYNMQKNLFSSPLSRAISLIASNNITSGMLEIKMADVKSLKG